MGCAVHVKNGNVRKDNARKDMAFLALYNGANVELLYNLNINLYNSNMKIKTFFDNLGAKRSYMSGSHGVLNIKKYNTFNFGFEFGTLFLYEIV